MKAVNMDKRGGPSNFFQQVYSLVSLVPYGRVASYGQIASLLGQPRAARTVGWALHGLPEGSSVPWHRIINNQGRITNSNREDSIQQQRSLLEAEGVVFGPDGRADMSQYRWYGPTFEALDAIWRGCSGKSGTCSEEDDRAE